MTCTKCKCRIVTHFWIVDERVYCSPRCERGRDSKENDKNIEKFDIKLK